MAIYRVRYWVDSGDGSTLDGYQEWFPSEVKAKSRVAELNRNDDNDDVEETEIKKLDSPANKTEWLKLLNRDAEYC